MVCSLLSWRGVFHSPFLRWPPYYFSIPEPVYKSYKVAKMVYGIGGALLSYRQDVHLRKARCISSIQYQIYAVSIDRDTAVDGQPPLCPSTEAASVDGQRNRYRWAAPLCPWVEVASVDGKSNC
eukprot:3547474-Pleurochrysis_carterae.AAC.1